MLKPLALFIGLRYLLRRRGGRFATLVSYASVAGIALGVAVLVIVLSVMNGFEREVSAHILGMTSHATVFQAGGALDDWTEVARRARAAPHVVGAQPFVRGSAMLNRRGKVRGVVVYGVPPTAEAQVSDLPGYIGRDTLASLGAEGRRLPVIVGATLADLTDSAVGRVATLIVPRWSPRTGAQAPHYAPIAIQGVFRVGMHEFDSSFVLMDLARAARLFDYGTQVTGLRIRFDDPASSLEYARTLQAHLGNAYLVLDWSQFHRNFFEALKSQKRILFVILSLIIAVAAFNVVAMMVMIVKDKRRDISILKTQGCRSSTILWAFLFQGGALGITGIGIGLFLGVLGARYANDAMQLLQRLTGLQLVRSDIYYISTLPADVRLGDLLSVGVATLVICLVATVYPAYRAARVHPVEALRYD